MLTINLHYIYTQLFFQYILLAFKNKSLIICFNDMESVFYVFFLKHFPKVNSLKVSSLYEPLAAGSSDWSTLFFTRTNTTKKEMTEEIKKNKTPNVQSRTQKEKFYGFFFFWIFCAINIFTCRERSFFLSLDHFPATLVIFLYYWSICSSQTDYKHLLNDRIFSF